MQLSFSEDPTVNNVGLCAAGMMFLYNMPIPDRHSFFGLRTAATVGCAAVPILWHYTTGEYVTESDYGLGACALAAVCTYGVTQVLAMAFESNYHNRPRPY
jgi:hypothetical protein